MPYLSALSKNQDLFKSFNQGQDRKVHVMKIKKDSLTFTCQKAQKYLKAPYMCKCRHDLFLDL